MPAAAPGRRTGLPRSGAAAAPAVVAASSAPPLTAAPATPATEPKHAGRFTRRQWLGGLAGAAGLLLLAALIVLFTRWFVTLDFMRDFLATYPGETPLPEGAPVGLPAWLGWQHFFNVFLIVLIIRSGWQVRTQTRRPAMWRRNNTGWFKTRGEPRRITLTLWSHFAFDAVWLLNGVIFVVLLFVSGQWMRVVPTSWEVFPNAASAALQYLSLDWPTENGWVNYNSLQLLAYFATIFIAAPLAALTGIRMSGAWPAKATRLNALYPVELARAIHLPVMLYFVLFIFVHVVLVLSTGALRNLNHMYGAQDAVNWTGFWIFAASLIVMVGGVLAARPVVLAPIAGLMGKVGR